MASDRSSSSFTSIAKNKQQDMKAAVAGSITLQPQPVSASCTPLEPSIRLFYSFLSHLDLLFFNLPALSFSILSGGVAPFMIVVVGNVFNSFADFPTQGEQTSSDTHSFTVLVHPLWSFSLSRWEPSHLAASHWRYGYRRDGRAGRNAADVKGLFRGEHAGYGVV
jgi:hypothetical protein